MKTLLFFSVITIFTLSSCSDNDEIPTSESKVKLIDLNSWKTSKTVSKEIDTQNSENGNKVVSESSETKDVDNENENRLDDEVSNTDSDFPDYKKELENSENEYSGDEVESENRSEKEIVSENEDIEVEKIDSTTSETETAPDYSDYEKDLKVQMEKAIVNYPRPPTPANLSPYDSRESSSYREPTTQESTTGSGNFPPMPPAMFLNR